MANPRLNARDWEPQTPQFRKKAARALQMPGALRKWEVDFLTKLRDADRISPMQRDHAEKLFARLWR